tara:strand:- start:1125 stop:1466 length:342 start_codon:yes stop_codon:yes gene_type:complete
MWEVIVEMASDRLWIYTGIAGSIAGAVFVAYVGKTRLGLWFYSKFDASMAFLAERWGWSWLQKPDDLWRKRYPLITAKMDRLEMQLTMIEDSIDNDIENRLSDLEDRYRRNES